MSKPDRYGMHPDRASDALRYVQTAHEFEMGGHKYRCHPLTPFEQIHVARRLAPIALSALRPEAGRTAIIARLATLASIGTKAEGSPGALAGDQQAIDDALDLAGSILGAAAETDEEMINGIIRKVMGKIGRESEGGGIMFMWNTKLDIPTYRDVDGFATLALVGRYLFFEFKDRIADYIATLNLKPGPALMAAMTSAQAGPRPPNAPGGI